MENWSKKKNNNNNLS